MVFFLAISLIAEEYTPPAVYYSGKCITVFACYVGGTVTCNPVWSGAGTNENIIDLLTIEDNQKRREKFERGLKNADEHQVLSANAYMRLAEKNRDENLKKHSRFLKIFPQYFAMNLMLQFNLRILMQHFLATQLYLIL